MPSIGRRLAGVLAVLSVATAGCSDDGGPRAFELHVRSSDHPVESVDLSDDWGHVEVEIIEAPDEVTAGGDDFPVVLEMHNTLNESISLDPCPAWEAGMGESSEVSNVEGSLPCDDIGSLRPGERIRLRMAMPPTEHATSSEGLGDRVALAWRLKGEFFQETTASTSFTMNGPR